MISLLPTLNRNTVSIFARILAPLALLWSIAWPEYSHFRIERTDAPTNALSAHASMPSVELLDELANMNLAVSLGIPIDRRADFAKQILDGQLIAPQFLSEPASLTGWPADLHLGGPTFQLILASLALEELLLEEFERTNENRFLSAARERILLFADWEKQQREPVAFLWNDHAIAARVPVLIRLWRHVRNDPNSAPDQLRSLVELIERSGKLLSKDSLFTARTNHGVMQNIALMQLSAAFPHLPEASQWLSLAMQRLELQLPFYVSKEGVVLEHSAEYHVFGNELLALAVRLAYLNGYPPSQSLVNSLLKASEFTKILMRPDGTLPIFGNTVAGISSTQIAAGSLATTPVSKIGPPFPESDFGSALFPISGYAIWWNKGTSLSQTVVAWAKHDRHGHKHADEPSVNFWSKGYDWISGTGYWPYGDQNFSNANGWLGSNAPHEENEKANSLRDSNLLSSGENDGFRFIELETKRDHGFSVRRQILQLQPETLLVLDFFSQAKEPVQTVWTMDPRIALSHLENDSYVGKVAGSAAQIAVSFASHPSSKMDIASYRGSQFPFAGWVVTHHLPTAAPALLTRLNNSSGVIATLISLENDSRTPILDLFGDPQAISWKVSASSQSGEYSVERSDSVVSVKKGRQIVQISLATPADISTPVKELRGAMTKAIETYPPWRPLKGYRQRLCVAIGILWIALEFVLLLFRRQHSVWANSAILVTWLLFAWWTHALYLR